MSIETVRALKTPASLGTTVVFKMWGQGGGVLIPSLKIPYVNFSNRKISPQFVLEFSRFELNFFFNFFLRERDQPCAHKWGQRERGTEDPKQAPCCQHRA